jgi:hypothetical protein
VIGDANPSTTKAGNGAMEDTPRLGASIAAVVAMIFAVAVL